MSILLPYQQRWAADPAQVQVCEKSRRIGITWASAIRAVLESGVEGGWDTYYSGYNSDLAKEFIRDAGDFARLLNVTVTENREVDILVDDGEFVFNDLDSNGQPKGILGYLIRFASGHQIVALSSHPRNLRGKKGRIILDEFAFHDSAEELLKAALAVIMWGGKLSIISTHNGVDNFFNRVVEDVRAGRFSYSLHRITLDDAIAEGLYERIADVLGLELSKEAQEKWRADLVNDYGDDADEELHCIPRRGGKLYFSPTLVQSRMREDHKVYRLKVDDDFALETDECREQHIAAWAESVLASPLYKLDKSRYSFVGEDFGRRSDLTCIAIGQEDTDLVLNVPIIVELRNVPYTQQQQLMAFILEKVPRLGKVVMDATGNGAYLAEVTAQQYGEVVVEQLTLSEKWYGENMPKFRARFEDKLITLPRDLDIRTDLTKIEVVNGIPRLPKIRTQSKLNRSEYRHGDAAVALALLDYACREGAQVFRRNRRPSHKPRGGLFPKNRRCL